MRTAHEIEMIAKVTPINILFITTIYIYIYKIKSKF
jgi:hypothetical protein